MTDPKLLERLRKSRTELTQSELAEKLGMSTSTYRRMLEGSTPITMDIVQRVSTFFKIPEATLLQKNALFDFNSDAHPEGLSAKDLWIMVRLDGSKKTLTQWIERLTKINETL
jgi:transcriptional regulator with XRE-family HTH domain